MTVSSLRLLIFLNSDRCSKERPAVYVYINIYMERVCIHYVCVIYIIYIAIKIIHIQIIYIPFTLIKIVNFAELIFTWMLTTFCFPFGLSFRSLSDAIILTGVLRHA